MTAARFINVAVAMAINVCLAALVSKFIQFGTAQGLGRQYPLGLLALSDR